MPLAIDPDAKYPVLAPGTYSATIVNYEEKSSKNGDPMTVLHLDVDDGEGGTHEVRHYLVSTTRNQKRLYDQCCEIYRACGLADAREFDPMKVDRKRVDVTLSVQEQPGYSPTNRIDSWSAPARSAAVDAVVAAVNATPRAAAAAAAARATPQPARNSPPLRGPARPAQPQRQSAPAVAEDYIPF